MPVFENVTFSGGFRYTVPSPTPSGPFTIVYTTTGVGQSITVPIRGSGLNANIDWGDGNTSNNVTTPNATRTFSSAGTYTVSITGTVPGFGILTGSQPRLSSVTSWGNVGLTDLAGAFFGANILTSVPSNLPSTVSNLRSCFRNAIQFNDSNITSWITTNVTNMQEMFRSTAGAMAFNQNIGNWNVSNVTNMGSMFRFCNVFNQNIGNWNVSNVSNTSFMFADMQNFNQNIGNWVTSKVTDMSYMFLNSTAFNQNIGNWKTGNVTNMGDMFNGATSFNSNLASWCVTNITTKPSGFDTNANSWTGSTATRPQWGTCPNP